MIWASDLLAICLEGVGGRGEEGEMGERKGSGGRGRSERGKTGRETETDQVALKGYSPLNSIEPRERIPVNTKEA